MESGTAPTSVSRRWLLHFDDAFVRSLLPSCVRKLSDWGVHPNVITAAALALAAAIPLLHFLGNTWSVIAAVMFHQILDCLDGEVARRSGKTSKLGGLLDSASDSMLIFGGITIIVSAFVRSVPFVFLLAVLLFLGLLAIHLHICAGAVLLDHYVKTYDTPSLYRRAFALVANDSLIFVTIGCLLYALLKR